MIRVLVADDHAVVRRGLVQILTEAPGIDVAAEAADGLDTLARVRAGAGGRPFDVAVVDLSMPGPSGLETLKALRAEHPRLAVLILSAHPESQYAVRAMKAGAAGYLTKEAAPDELVAAVRRAAAGGRYVSPGVADALLGALGDAAEAPHAALSDREFDVMRRLAAGEAVGAVAESLALSVKTVSTYRTRVLAKLGLGSNAELARYAVEHGLIE